MLDDSRHHNSQTARDKSRVLLHVLDISPVNLEKIESVIIFEANPYHQLDPYFAATLKEEAAKDTSNLSKKIKVIDLAKSLSKEEYYYYDDHWNERGHRKVADLILAELK
jgi:hypothetical protein